MILAVAGEGAAPSLLLTKLFTTKDGGGAVWERKYLGRCHVIAAACDGVIYYALIAFFSTGPGCKASPAGCRPVISTRTTPLRKLRSRCGFGISIPHALNFFAI